MRICISSDDDGLASPVRMIELLDRGEERIQVDKKDRRRIPVTQRR